MLRARRRRAAFLSIEREIWSIQKNNTPPKKKQHVFFGGGVFLFFIFLFLNVWSNQCSRMEKSIFWIARNICRVIGHRFFAKLDKKIFRYRKIGQKRHFSLCKFSRIFYEGIFRKKIFFVFFGLMEGGLSFTVFSWIHDETIGYSFKKECCGVPKVSIDVLAIDFSSTSPEKALISEKQHN